MSTADALATPALRALWGPLVGRLARAARLADPSLAEDAVQAAMMQAVRTWPLAGTPAKPAAWLTTVARRQLIDLLRARRSDVSFDALTDAAPEAIDALAGVDATEPARGVLDDDELALLFACCDPDLPVASQVAFALQTVCGFSLREIAAGLLSNESALAQRLARARDHLARRGRAVCLPLGDELAPRRDAVLAAIALLFNEGYACADPAAAQALQRPDLCREAMRLARGVAAHPHTAHPDADALAAMLLLHGARLPARVAASATGEDWLLLDEQPRDRWDRDLIALGLAHLQRAQRAAVLSRWHLHAGIAAEHATAARFADTAWHSIATQYDTLRQLDPSPLVALAQGIAWLHAGDLARGRDLVSAALPVLPPMQRHLGHAALGDAWRMAGAADAARAAYQQALDLAPHDADRRVLQAKLAAL